MGIAHHCKFIQEAYHALESSPSTWRRPRARAGTAYHATSSSSVMLSFSHALLPGTGQRRCEYENAARRAHARMHLAVCAAPPTFRQRHPSFNPSRYLNRADSACVRIVRVRCRSRTVRSRIHQLADRHQYACTHIKFIKIRSFERACGPAEVGYSEQVARIRSFRCDRP